MPRALIVSAGNNANEYLARHMADLGYTRPAMAASGGEARRQMDAKDFEVIVINTPLPDEFGHELGTDAVTKTDAGVLLLTKTATADQIADKLQEFGVLVLGKPFTGAQLRLVDRAKCYLIEKKHYTETEAHRLIEKMAMDTRRPRGEIAQEILEEDDEE